MPDKIRPFFNRILYFLRPKIARLLTYPWFRNTRKTKQANNQLASLVEARPNQSLGKLFSPGDVLISVGLDWDYPYYKEFYNLRKNNGIKVITCCYDLIPVIYPQYCVGAVSELFTSYFLDVADGSDMVLCISEQSRKDFLSLMDKTGGAKPATHIIPLGDNVPISSEEVISSEVKAICSEPFILFVSTIERRKNHEVLYRAYHLLCSEGKRDYLPKLVFVGMKGWGVDELFSDIKLDPLTRDLIITINHISDSELRALYDAAKFCVYPSLYEGWGLPVGEALSLGKAVLSSDRGSLPEVGGEAVQYIDPWNPRDWADKIYRMATDDAWLTEWEQRTKQQYHSRTWSMTANSVKATIDNMCKATD
jgi:glycosyltransferase involved in cell wall biosynthesis